MPLYTHATEVSEEVDRDIEDSFNSHTWDGVKADRAAKVRRALVDAVKVIIANVPPSADRSAALRKIREAKMDATSAISCDGRF